MILCVHLTQEKVYHSLDVNFLTSDSFASCTEMDNIGNSILGFFILGPKTVIKALRVLVGTAALKRSNREVVS